MLLLLKACDSWRAAHGGELPHGSAEQRAFREHVRAMQRRSPEGVPFDVRPYALKP